ncbi:hypothetical protein J2T58_001265 [Methanocalculus alkaliphilus]|nr:hypothetical protein [Methanocalculus alkaliphilus]
MPVIILVAITLLVAIMPAPIRGSAHPCPRMAYWWEIEPGQVSLVKGHFSGLGCGSLKVSGCEESA